MTEKRKRGRPAGTVLSEETKRKIGAGVRERRSSHGPVPAGDAALDVRAAVFERDGKKCVGCHEPYIREKGFSSGRRNSSADFLIYRFAAAREGAGLDAYATLCGECRVGIRAGTTCLEEFLTL